MTELENWTPARVKQALDAGEIVLIDVRTPPEYMMEHVRGALLMPMAFFRADALPTQDGKRIVLHCGSGIRSGKVAQAAMESGLKPLAHMEGGFAAWKKAGLPYVGTDPASGAPKDMTAD
ncbi:rhodanese-like domain-containing protein [Tateyamaria pelophila]|uniref:rhodanese-like domain-containing protein n=1 Tax=Tateyamaria pelophila TaxID=328415 RepID=UPI001CC05746|nr:rhodanese-like domain-containing protein [Tateyamaria pelophila]